MRTIALEEHFVTPALMDGPGRKLKERAETSGGGLATLVGQLADIGDGRVAAMDAARIDVQALSLTAPGVEQLEVEEANRSRAKPTPLSPTRSGDIRRDSSGSSRCRSAIRSPRSPSLSARPGRAGSRAWSSTAVIVGAIWTTASSGRFSRALRRSGFRSICTRRNRRKLSSTPGTAAFRRWSAR